MTNEQTESTEPTKVFDGLLVIGRLTEIRELKSRASGQVVIGMANAVFDTSRGEEIVGVQRVLRTAVGAFNLDAFDKLMDRRALDKTWIVTVGKQTSSGYTNFVALDCKEYA